MEKQLHLQPVTSVHTTRVTQRKWIKHKPIIPVYFIIDCSTNTGDCLYQFYESFHRQGIEKSQGSWCKESDRRRQKGSHQTIFR